MLTYRPSYIDILTKRIHMSTILYMTTTDALESLRTRLGMADQALAHIEDELAAARRVNLRLEAAVHGLVKHIEEIAAGDAPNPSVLAAALAADLRVTPEEVEGRRGGACL